MTSKFPSDRRHKHVRVNDRPNHASCPTGYRLLRTDIDRTTGRVLGVADFVPKDKWPTLRQRLSEGASKKVGGKQNLQNEVIVAENFYFDKAGLLFVYNPYEIACGAIGDVEVLIDLKTL